MLNVNCKKFINKEYTEFIRRLPCLLTGIQSDTDPHHAATRGATGQNDYYQVPLSHSKAHYQGLSHITEKKLTEQCQLWIGIPVEQIIIIYLSLFIEYKAGRYDLDADEMNNFYELRKCLRSR